MKQALIILSILMFSLPALANIKFMPTKIDLETKDTASFRIINTFDEKIDFSTSVVDEDGKVIKGAIFTYPKLLTAVGDAEVKLKKIKPLKSDKKLYLRVESISTSTPFIFQVRINAHN